MKTLLDLYNEDSYVASNFLDSMNLQVSVLLTGISLQVYYNDETGKYEYHTHSDDLAIGPKISKLTKLFCKDITDAIAYLDERGINGVIDGEKTVAEYKFLNFVIYDKQLYLLSAMRMGETTILDGFDELSTIADSLKVGVMPLVFKGRLTKEQQASIINFIISQKNLDSAEFKDVFKSILKAENFNADPTITARAMESNVWDRYTTFDGLVFSVNFGDKIAKYKINDPNYEQIRKNVEAQRKLNKDLHKADYRALIEAMVDWLETRVEKRDDKHVISLQKNFVEMCADKKMLMKLISLGAKLPVRTNSRFMLQPDMLTPDMQQLLRKHGTPMRSAVEQYLLSFYANKDIDVDDEMKKRVAEIVSKI